MYLDKVAELSFWAEMSEIADSENHVDIFSSLDKVAEMDKAARRRVGNPILNIRGSRRRSKKQLFKYFSRVASPITK